MGRDEFVLDILAGFLIGIVIVAVLALIVLSVT